MLLTRLNLEFEAQDATHFTLAVTSWQEVQSLAIEDSVKWIEDSDEGMRTYSQNTWPPTETTPVMHETALRGDGLVVAIGDSDHVAEDHPAMVGRVTKANAPVDAGSRDPSHAHKGAAIMVSDGTAVPEAVGFLPEADLITYKMTGTFTTKRRYYHVPTEAREDYEAVLINNSWGSTDNCNKIGEYTQKSKWRDKAVHDSGILIVDAAGNRRGVDGSLNEAVLRTNHISDVGTGISEEICKDSQIDDNDIWGVAPFFVSVGISSSNSQGEFFHISGNDTSRTLTGIAVSGPGPQHVSNNMLAAFVTGISMDAGGTTTSSTISANTVVIDAQPAPGIGITVSASPGLLVQNNTISNSLPNPVDVTAISVSDSSGARINGNTCTLQGDAIIVNSSDDVELADNVVDAQGLAMAVQGNVSQITGNTLTAAVGLRASGDQCLIEANTADATTSVGIHLAAGIDAVLRDNVVTPVSGTGVRLGSEPPPCGAGTPITVDNALLENKTISGTPALDILCDVGAYLVVP